jgi:hypothetical protein
LGFEIVISVAVFRISSKAESARNGYQQSHMGKIAGHLVRNEHNTHGGEIPYILKLLGLNFFDIITIMKHKSP